MSFLGKVAIVTGSGQGLGKAFAEKLLLEGAKVCISDMNSNTGEKTMEEFKERFGQDKVTYVSCDVTVKEQLEALVSKTIEELGGLDIFCNNAGINHNFGWRKCMDVDIMAVMEATEIVMEKMSQEKGGRGGLIVNTASMAGILNGIDKESACYFVAKHGVVTLTRTLASKAVFSRTGVKVQCICPSFTDTEIVSSLPSGTLKSVQKKYGIMPVSVIGDAFLELVKNGGNGAALGIVKDHTPFYIPDTSRALLLLSVMTGKVFQPLGVKVVRVEHLIAFLVLVHVFLWLLFYVLF